MKKLIAGVMALTFTTSTSHHLAETKVMPIVHLVRPAVRHVATLVSAPVMKAWNRVYLCETHNWRQQGIYGGGLGITLWNWQHHGGLRFASAPWLATPDQQVYVATLIQHGLPVPDQDNTCRNW